MQSEDHSNGANSFSLGTQSLDAASSLAPPPSFPTADSLQNWTLMKTNGSSIGRQPYFRHSSSATKISKIPSSVSQACSSPPPHPTTQAAAEHQLFRSAHETHFLVKLACASDSTTDEVVHGLRQDNKHSKVFCYRVLECFLTFRV